MTANEPFFSTIIQQSKRVSYDEFAVNFGGIDHDVVEMLGGEEATTAIRDARHKMEEAGSLPSGQPRFRQGVEFGIFDNAPELEKGEVAAVDGTYALPLQLYSAGQSLCIGVGSLSYRRPMQESLTYWSSKAYLAEATDTSDFVGRVEDGIFGISQSGFLRYYEIQHGIEIDEPIILFDGTLVYEWLLATPAGLDLYRDLFSSGKKCIGIMKSMKNNATFATWARALRTGEIFIIETLADHLDGSHVTNKNPGEAHSRFASKQFQKETAPYIFRGVFKPSKKAFAFEVHEDHLEDMLRIVAADCQLNHIGHQIPFLLNRVDEAVQHQFKQNMLRDRIAVQMSAQSEELFFEETNERDFR